MIVLKPTEAREFQKSKYDKRWKGADGKWHYKYGTKTRERWAKLYEDRMSGRANDPDYDPFIHQDRKHTERVRAREEKPLTGKDSIFGRTDFMEQPYIPKACQKIRNEILNAKIPEEKKAEMRMKMDAIDKRLPKEKRMSAYKMLRNSVFGSWTQETD